MKYKDAILTDLGDHECVKRNHLAGHCTDIQFRNTLMGSMG